MSSHYSIPSMRDLVGPPMFGIPVVPPVFLPLDEEPELGPRLVALFAAEEALSLWGRGNPSGPDAHPAFTFAPRFTGVLSYLEAQQ